MFLKRLEEYISSENSVRHKSIQLAAYFKAEKAGFPQGQEFSFWIEAEREYDERYEKFIVNKSPWDRFMYKIGIRN
jgi:hypothetical protein